MSALASAAGVAAEAANTSITGWVIGYAVAIVVVLAVVALVLPILVLAKSIADEATLIDESLKESVQNTAALKGLRITNDHAGVIVAGLARGRARLGG